MNKVVFQANNSKVGLNDQSIDRNNLNKLTELKGLLHTKGRAFSRYNTPDEFSLLHPMPTVIPFNKSFADVTDSRADDLIHFAESSDLPIVVSWSGGIDSTLMLAAMVKILPKYMLDRIVVLMSNMSYLENPNFFHKIIEKNNISYTSDTMLDYETAITIDGDPADPIWIQGEYLNLYANHPEIADMDLIHDPDLLFKWVNASGTYTPEYVDWVYNYIINDDVPDGVELRTYEDFYWWMNFNYAFNPTTNRHLNRSHNLTTNSLSKFKQNHFVWYGSDEYQLWSIQNRNTPLKFAGTPRSYKMPAKEYIYDVDSNARFRDYKTKSRSPYVEQKVIDTVYDNGEIVLLNGTRITAASTDSQ